MKPILFILAILVCAVPAAGHDIEHEHQYTPIAEQVLDLEDTTAPYVYPSIDAAEKHIYIDVDKECVPLSEVIETLEYFIKSAEEISDPECHTWVAKSDCYRSLAEYELAKERMHVRAVDVLERLKKEGCVE